MSLSWPRIGNEGWREELHDGRIGGSAGQCRSRRSVALKLFRRPVSQCRMQPQAIVISTEELFQMLGKLVEIRILVAVDFFLFQSLHKALTSRVIVGIGGTAHAGNLWAAPETPSVFGARIRAALIGVMHASRRRLALPDRLL